MADELSIQDEETPNPLSDPADEESAQGAPMSPGSAAAAGFGDMFAAKNWKDYKEWKININNVWIAATTVAAATATWSLTHDFPQPAATHTSTPASAPGVMQAAEMIEEREKKGQACKGLLVFLLFLGCYVSMLKLQLNIEDAYVRRPLLAAN
jgi:hypothetical protein